MAGIKVSTLTLVAILNIMSESDVESRFSFYCDIAAGNLDDIYMNDGTVSKKLSEQEINEWLREGIKRLV